MDEICAETFLDPAAVAVVAPALAHHDSDTATDHANPSPEDVSAMNL
jgi:hypothetical protein